MEGDEEFDFVGGRAFDIGGDRVPVKSDGGFAKANWR